MAVCNECQVPLRPGARICDHCGTRVQQKRKKTKIIYFIPIVAIGLALTLGYLASLLWGSVDLNKVPEKVQEEIVEESPENYRYAHSIINIRAGRSTEFDIVSKISRGDTVKLDSIEGSWAIVLDEYDLKRGYVYEKVLRSYPLPDFEVLDWTWAPDPEFDGGEGAVVFTATVQNNTGKIEPALKVEFTTYDANNKILTSDFMFINDLQPGEVKADTAYTTYFGREKTAILEVKP